MVPNYQATWRHIPEESFNIHCSDNLRFHTAIAMTRTSSDVTVSRKNSTLCIVCPLPCYLPSNTFNEVMFVKRLQNIFLLWKSLQPQTKTRHRTSQTVYQLRTTGILKCVKYFEQNITFWKCVGFFPLLKRCGSVCSVGSIRAELNHRTQLFLTDPSQWMPHQIFTKRWK
jgi:hypothetical protein